MRIFSRLFAGDEIVKMRAAVAAAADQALLSALNFAIALVFIRFGDKDDYGFYVMLMSLVYLVQSIQNALILSPLATVMPAQSTDLRQATKATAKLAQLIFYALAAPVATIFVWIYAKQAELAFSFPAAAAFAIAVAGVAAREGTRAVAYCEGRIVGALGGDLIYAFGVVVGLGFLWFTGHVASSEMLAAMGLAAFIPYLIGLIGEGGVKFHKEMWGKLWACGRWSLIGAMLSWFNLYAYPLIVGLRNDASTVAELNAARLFMTPVAVGLAAWSNLFRPKVSAWTAQRQITRVRRLSIGSISVGVGILAVFGLAVFLTYPWLEPLLGAQYVGLLPLVVAWCIFFMLSIIRTVMMATLMVDERGYRILQLVSVVSLAITLTGLWGGSPFGVIAIVGVLCVVELVQAVWIGSVAWLRWRAV